MWLWQTAYTFPIAQVQPHLMHSCNLISFYNTSLGHVNPPGRLPVYFGLQIMACLPRALLHLPRFVF